MLPSFTFDRVKLILPQGNIHMHAMHSMFFYSKLEKLLAERLDLKPTS